MITQFQRTFYKKNLLFTYRLLKGGLLKLDYGGVLPLDEHNPNCRLRNACVRSGDERVNHNAGRVIQKELRILI